MWKSMHRGTRYVCNILLLLLHRRLLCQQTQRLHLTLDPVGELNAHKRVLERALTAPVMCVRSIASAVNYSDKATFTMHMGTPDEAITYMLVHKVKPAEACRKVDCCKMKLSRAIDALKVANLWEDHCHDLLAHAAKTNAEG